MLKEQARLVARLTVVTDLTLVTCAFVLAYLIRARWEPALFALRDYAWTLLVILPVWLAFMARAQFFASIRRLSLWEILRRLSIVHLYGACMVASVIFFIDRNVFSRSLFIIFVLLSFSLLALEKAALRLILGYFRSKGYNYRQILIVGTRDKARRFNELVNEHADWGMRVVGFVQAIAPPLQQKIEGLPVLGHMTDLVEICKNNPVDEVVFCLPRDMLIDAEGLVLELEEMGITVRMVLDFFKTKKARKEISLFHNEIPILTFHTKSLDAQQLLLKRFLDVFGAFCGLVLTALLFPLIALAVKLDSPGPLFFSQKRIGESGRTFRCWKFRTMYMDAEARKGELMAQNEMSGAIFKIKDDPRVTRVGKILRRMSLDELPQFWNVLKGDMSLVGTRPPTPDEVVLYENWHRRRISIKPGITGMWQVNGRSGIDNFDEIVRLDLKYIDQWSLWLDLKILLRTVQVVFSRRGSY
jgi:exopolysaccharide biosynthesis polyprenyl glycosylphosphotransferase